MTLPRSGASKTRSLSKALGDSLRPHAAILGLTVVVSVGLGFAQVVGLGAFVPIIGVVAGAPLDTFAKIPVLGRLVAMLPADRHEAVVVLLALLFTLVAMRSLLGAVVQTSQARVKNLVDGAWQRKVIGHWLALPPLQHTRDSKSRLQYLCDQEVRNIGVGAAAVVTLAAALAQVVFTIAFLALVSWQAMILTAAFIIVIVVPLSLMTRRMFAAAQRDSGMLSSYSERIFDVIRRVELIDVFRTHDRELSGLHGFMRRYLGARLDLEKTRLAGPVVVEIGSAGLLCGVILFLTAHGGGTEAAAQVILFVGGLISVQPQLTKLNAAMGQLVRVGSAFERLDEVLAQPLGPARDVTAAAGHGDVVVDHLTFRYAADAAPVLDDACLTIPHGKLTLLFGASGAGKTTFLKLLQGLYGPSAGRIVVGGVDLADVAADAWCEQAILMPQENIIFNGTVRDNLTYGRGEVADQHAFGACKAACADDFIQKMKFGYDSVVGSEGALLSGGQRQRLALARVLAKQPRLLLLDEPTSALDRMLEQQVLRNLLDLRRTGTTIVMSTHKIDLAPFADHLLWFEGGRVREGTFADFEAALAHLLPLVAKT